MLRLILLYSGLAFIINLVLTPVIIYICHRNDWYDPQDDRKIHTAKTPRLGGAGFFLSIVLSILFFNLFPQLTGLSVRFFTGRNILLFSGFILIHLIGLLDDFRNIPALYKFAGQILAAMLVAAGGALIGGIYLPLIQFTVPLGPLNGVITVFWLISISNAMNLIDGMDGLAGGIAVVASGGIGLMHILTANTVGALYSFVFLGAVLAFLLFNKPTARIFMGDSGSLFIGFFLAALAFVGQGDPSLHWPEPDGGAVFVISVLIIPIADMITAILRRIRKGKPIYAPDREHLHHKLLALGMSQWSVLILVIVGSLAMSGAAIGRMLLILGGSALAGDIMLLSAWVIVIVLFIILHHVHKRHKHQTETSD